MTLRDRGKKKWQSAFFMPEQTKMIRGLYNEDLFQKKPILDMYEMERNERKIHSAYKDKCLLKIVFWNGGNFKEWIETVDKLDGIGKSISLRNQTGNHLMLNFENIVEVEILR